METVIADLKEGKSISIITDCGTYLACNANNEERVKELNELTQEESDKRILLDSLHLLEKHVPEFNPICYDLIETSTKPLTIIYPSFKGLPISCGLANGKIAIRVLEDQKLTRLVRSIHYPLFCVPCTDTGETETIELSTYKSREQVIQIGLNGEVKIIQN